MTFKRLRLGAGMGRFATRVENLTQEDHPRRAAAPVSLQDLRKEVAHTGSRIACRERLRIWDTV